MLGYRRNILRKFAESCWRLWWGDPFDVRFYLVKKTKGIHFKRVLDVGCGAGIILSEMPENGDKVGIDISQESLRTAKMVAKEALFVMGDIHFMPFRNDIFDLVLIANSLSKYDFNIKLGMGDKWTPERLLSETYRVLMHNGLLFLTTPNKWHQAYRLSKKIDCPTL